MDIVLEWNNLFHKSILQKFLHKILLDNYLPDACGQTLHRVWLTFAVLHAAAAIQIEIRR